MMLTRNALLGLDRLSAANHRALGLLRDHAEQFLHAAGHGLHSVVEVMRHVLF